MNNSITPNNITNIIVDDFLYRIYLTKKFIYSETKYYLSYHKNYVLETLNSIINKINNFRLINFNNNFNKIYELCIKYIELINTTEINLENYYNFLSDIEKKIKDIV